MIDRIMSRIRRVVYSIGLRPRPGSVFYSPSIAMRLAFEEGMSKSDAIEAAQFFEASWAIGIDPVKALRAVTRAHAAGIHPWQIEFIARCVAYGDFRRPLEEGGMS